MQGYLAFISAAVLVAISFNLFPIPGFTHVAWVVQNVVNVCVAITVARAVQVTY